MPLHPSSGSEVVTTSESSFVDFIARLHAGDSTAGGELFVRFAGRLVALARRQFGAGLQHKVDPEDVVQSAYKSFFYRFRDGKLQVESWNSLWGLLTVITLRKCCERATYHRAACRDASREVAAAESTEGGYLTEAISREPTPYEAVLLSETVDQLLSELDATSRPVVELSLMGYTTQEISEQLGRPERTVRRLRERVREQLEQRQTGQ